MTKPSIIKTSVSKCKLVHWAAACILWLTSATTASAGGFDECLQNFTDHTPPQLIGTKGEKLSQAVQPLCFEGFATLYSPISRTPVYSASHLTRERVQQAQTLPRVDSFRVENRLPEQARAYLEHYRGSGFDRGHIAPNGDMSNADQQYDSFSLANIAPQDGEHNRNLWRHIESATRHLAVVYGEIFVVTGVAFEGERVSQLAAKVLVPTHFFKAVYIPSIHQAGVYYSENHAAGSYTVLSLDEFAQRTGIAPMPSLAPNIRQSAYALPSPENQTVTKQPLQTSADWWVFLKQAWAYLTSWLQD